MTQTARVSTRESVSDVLRTTARPGVKLLTGTLTSNTGFPHVGVARRLILHLKVKAPLRVCRCFAVNDLLRWWVGHALRVVNGAGRGDGQVPSRDSLSGAPCSWPTPDRRRTRRPHTWGNRRHAVILLMRHCAPPAGVGEPHRRQHCDGPGHAPPARMGEPEAEPLYRLDTERARRTRGKPGARASCPRRECAGVGRSFSPGRTKQRVCPAPAPAEGTFRGQDAFPPKIPRPRTSSRARKTFRARTLGCTEVYGFGMATANLACRRDIHAGTAAIPESGPDNPVPGAHTGPSNWHTSRARTLGCTEVYETV